MSQTKKQSMIEVCVGTAIGIVGSLAITMSILHTVHDRVIAGTVTVAVCTVWSLVRSYLVRRHFNGEKK